MSNNPETAPNAEIQEIANYVFSGLPRAPRSIWLDLSTETARDFDNPEEREVMLVNMYVDIALLGCKKLWGDNFVWTNMTREQAAELQKYMNSLGVQLNILCNEDGADPWDTAETRGIEAIRFLKFSIAFI
jgi:hypothetical protein